MLKFESHVCPKQRTYGTAELSAVRALKQWLVSCGQKELLRICPPNHTTKWRLNDELERKQNQKIKEHLLLFKL